MTENAGARNVWGSIRIGLTWGFAALIAALGAATLVLPAAADATPLAVLTPSMEPALPVGTLVVVQPTPPDEIRLGDVITYQLRPGEPTLVTHRVVEVRSMSTGDTQFVTQGDANDAPDPTVVLGEQVKGRVWYSVPLAGFVSMAVSGSLPAVVLPVVGMALMGYAAYTLISASVNRARKTTRTGRRSAAGL